MTIVSYAQNGEDVVLHRLFGSVSSGVWIDVGAGHPELDSVTRRLSEQGWWGVNLEPDPSLLAQLEAERPRDRNLGVAASDHEGRATLHVAPAAGRSTIEPALVAPELGAWGTAEVPVTTVASIAAELGLGRIDLLKIDAEGHERLVLMGADLAGLRPRVVLVEATEPGRPVPSYEAWEPILFDAGYMCVLDDGLNRFYVEPADDEARRALRYPANVHDDFVRFADHQRSEAVRALELELAEARVRVAALESEAAARTAELDGLRAIAARAGEAEARLVAVDGVLSTIEEQLAARLS